MNRTHLKDEHNIDTDPIELLNRDGNRKWKTNSNPITNRKWKRKTNNRKFRIHQSEIFIPNRKKNRKRKISENNWKIPQCSDLNRNIIGTQSEIFPLFLLFRLFRIRPELEHKGRIRTIGTNWVEIGNFYCVPICSDLFQFFSDSNFQGKPCSDWKKIKNQRTNRKFSNKNNKNSQNIGNKEITYKLYIYIHLKTINN